MKVVIEVELGNDAVQTGEDVIHCIDQFSVLPDRGALRCGEEGVVYDVNGNRVGSWKVMLS